ncbi:N-carbamoyl-L-amino-acid hydrolase [Agrilactobacillus composti DSM 18527 = JCM 14202]|uniref:N-carbamoyl-L-amino-acid hydrolase n=1 Tax=Agrilactobacillus composti DSM 18527 = JCM 14202 TaxID=1423734 RepID=A0A0R1XV53_9LACO|nr:hydantoinase/carbamoylase family amidase [Agrilactobacillus composti]KRM31883.1 N-carbamoyl-L-amino-acid hydrolase [Agrilactobacillus composti DSM 18527 = JCM 14202]
MATDNIDPTARTLPDFNVAMVQLTQHLDTINRLSPDTAGQNRLVYSPGWIAAQGQLLQWGLDLGLNVTLDDYGTVYLDLVGSTQPETIIATGSHMDTVVQGGPLDGLYGVLGGLQALITLKQTLGQPKKTLRVIAFSEEEGSRFPTTFSGSKHYARIENTTGLKDKDGLDFDSARTAAVQQLTGPGIQRTLPKLPATFTELHIEQGTRLAAAQVQIGLVAAIVGQRRYTVTVTGVANHAGTTPMAQRHDALQATVQFINRLCLLAQSVSPELTFTVGELALTPNTVNVIPGKVVFSVDCRHTNTALLDNFETLMANTAELFTETDLTIHVSRWANIPPVQLDQQLLAQNANLADQLQLKHLQLASGAGHDSQIMTQVTPTTMIFVPSIQGISHAPQEATATPDLLAGVQLLTASLYRQAY